MSKTKGFGIVGIITIIAALAVVGFVGWRVYEATKPTVSVQPAVVDPNAGYIVIKEWGLRLKPTAGLTGVQYSINSTATSVSFSNSTLAANGDACSASQSGMAPLGMLERSSDAPGYASAFRTQINGYFYSYVTPQSPCSIDTQVTALQTSTLSLFKSSIVTLELAK
jgi:hypothetical protein